MIEKTKSQVESTYNIANGHSHDAEVIYGDTDSVMVKFGPEDLETVMRLGDGASFHGARRGLTRLDVGAEAAALVTQSFIAPIKLEFEKVYYPYLLINKKRYAGLYWTKPEKYDKMDSKGIEVRMSIYFAKDSRLTMLQTVRRDNCRLVSTVIETCLHKMLIDRDVKGAERSVPSMECSVPGSISIDMRNM